MAAKPTTLRSPSGETYQTADRAEITRLKARGYTEEKPAPVVAPPPVSKKSD